MKLNYEEVLKYLDQLVLMSGEKGDEFTLRIELSEIDEKIALARENLRSLEMLMTSPSGYEDANDKITKNFIKYNLERENNDLRYKISKKESALRPKELLIDDLNTKLRENDEAIARSKKCIEICRKSVVE